MLKWLAYPMIRGAAAFVFGILFSFHWNISDAHLGIHCLVISLIYAFLLRITSADFISKRYFFLLLASLQLLSFGMLRGIQGRYMVDTQLAETGYYYAKVTTPTKGQGKSLCTIAEVSAVWMNDTCLAANDKIIWYQDSAQEHRYTFGEELIIRGTPKRLNAPDNPQEFDYARFMASKNIFWSHWIDSSDIMIRVSGDQSSLLDLSFRLKESFSKRLIEWIPAGDQYQIASAMLLGDREVISIDLEQAFANSGAIHVLAVSGLHMGILYGIMVFLMGSWCYHKWLRWFYMLLVLAVIWLFTLITGMSASTQRAATMISVLVVASVLSKQSNTPNTLAISALIIVWANPNQIGSVGFQLSFAAVGGIMVLAPMISKSLPIKSKYLQYLWQLLSASLAAQLAVLPLCAYYFHQLPVYFLMTNLFIVPLAFVIIVAGILFFIGSFFSFFTNILAIPLTYATEVASLIVRTVAKLPHNTISEIQINSWQIILWYGILISLVVFIRSRKRWPLALAALLICTNLGIRISQQIMAVSRSQIVVYKIKGHTAIDFINGTSFQQVMDPDLKADRAAIEYKINGYRRYLKLKQPINLSTDYSQASGLLLWTFKGKRLLLIRSDIDRFSANKLQIDSHIVYVSKNSVKDLDQLSFISDFDLLIIDCSNNRVQASTLQQQALRNGIEVHNCWEDGYKIINL